MSKKTNHADKKKLKGKWRCADCMAIKSFFGEIKDKDETELLYLNL